MPCSRRNRGFTLVELVIVIVLMSIVSLAGVEIIRQSSEIYLKQNNRQGLSGSARLAVERLSREFRNALPGSVRVSGDCLEYLPIRVAGTYFSVPIGTPQTSITVAAVSTDLAGESGRVAIYSVGANPYDETSDILSPVATIGAPDGDSISTISWSGSALPFTVADPGLSRNAIVMLAFDFSTGGETIQVTHEVQLRNVP